MKKESGGFVVGEFEPEVWAIRDINEDGVPELLFGGKEGELSKSVVTNLYTLYNGIAKEVVSSFYGSASSLYYVGMDGYIYFNYPSEFHKFNFNNGEAELIEGWNSYDSYWKDGISGNVLSWEEFDNYFKKCESNYFIFDNGNSKKLERLDGVKAPKGFSNEFTSNINNNTDEALIKYAKEMYSECKIIDGVVIDSGDERDSYKKFAIADFDGDGLNELTIEVNHTGHNRYYGGEEWNEIRLFKLYNSSYVDYYNSIMYADFSNTTFYDNGVAEFYNADESLASFYLFLVSENGEIIDNRRFFILNNEILSKLNYSTENVENVSIPVLTYFKDGDVIHKGFGGIVNGPSLDVIKTQEDYDNDMKILHSGNAMDIEVKDFTAENLGL